VIDQTTTDEPPGLFLLARRLEEPLAVGASSWKVGSRRSPQFMTWHIGPGVLKAKFTRPTARPNHTRQTSGQTQIDE
jgi:hypothetical protein